MIILSTNKDKVNKERCKLIWHVLQEWIFHVKTHCYLINIRLWYGTSTANKIVEEANVSADTRVKDLTDDELGRIREVVDSYKVEGDLRREQNLNIKRLMEISSYRGIRHRRGLPVRGQKLKQRVLVKARLKQ